MGDWRVIYELVKEVGTLIGALAAIVGAILWCVRQIRSYRQQAKARADEEREFDEKLAEYYKSLGEQAEPQKRADLASVIAIKGLLAIKDENHIQHIASRMFLLTAILLGWAVWTTVSRKEPSLISSLINLTIATLVIAMTVVAAVASEKIDKKIERNRLKFSKYLESASKDLLEDKFK